MFNVSSLLSGAVVFSLFNIFTKNIIVADVCGETVRLHYKHNSVKNTE